MNSFTKGKVAIDRSIATWLNSNLLVVMVPAASPFFVCMQLRDKRCCWHFEKILAVQKKLCFVPLKSRFPSSLRPTVESCALLSLCLVCWAGSERLASAQFQLQSRRQRGFEVYLSTWENSALLGKLGSLSVTWRTWSRCNAGSYTL